MAKKIFYLNNDPEFFETIESDLITWSFRYDGKVIYSLALRELVEENFFLN